MQRLTRTALRHPGATLACLAAITLLLGAGALRITTDVGYRSLLGASHPAVERFDGFLARFDAGFPLAAVWSCDETSRCENALDPAALRMAAAVVAALEAEPSIRRAESPATSALLVPGEDDPEVRYLTVRGEVPPDLDALAERALRDSLWTRWLLSEDGRVGAVVVEVVSSESADNAAAYAALDAALAPFESAGWHFHRVGGPVEFVVAGGDLQADVAKLVPVMILLVGAVLLVLFRSLAVAVASLVTVGVAVVWSFGAMGWLGWPQNTVSQALPPLLLVIGICDVIHVMARYATDAGAHPERNRAALLEGVAADVGSPCVLTSLTTAAGFASFATSGLESFLRFGAIAALGVMAALVLTFTLLPILAVRIAPDGVRATRASAAWDRWLSRVVRFAETRAVAVVSVTAIATVLFATGFAQLRVDATFEDLYGEDSRVVRWTRFVGDHLRRPDTLEVVLHAPPDTDPALPEVLGTVERSSGALAGIEGLGPARSLADPVSLVHQLASGDDPFWYRVPGREADVREILELLDERDPSAISHWLDRAGPSFRIALEAEKPPQDVMRRIFADVEARLAETLPPGWTAELTGPLAVVHDMVDEIQRTQLRSFATAALVVLVLVAVFLRSLTAALLALVPTVLPVIVTLGSMGLVGVSLDVGSAMVAAVVIGVAVDDAIHLLSQYRRRRLLGRAAHDAMHDAVVHVGRAVVTTSVALTLGFTALTLSSWKTIAGFGALAALSIVGALVAVLLVLPALVRVTSRRNGHG